MIDDAHTATPIGPMPNANRSDRPSSSLDAASTETQSYIREYSAGDVVRSAIELYRAHFRSLTFTVLVAIFPFTLFTATTIALQSSVLTNVAKFVEFLVSLVALGAVTLSVADICLGNQPSTFRSYKRIGRHLLWRMIAISFLQIFFIAVGTIMLIVPGVLAALWFIFPQVVLAVENTGVRRAFKRSKVLGKGFYFRNSGIIMLLYAAMMALGMGVAFGVLAAFMPVLTVDNFHWYEATIRLAVGLTTIVFAVPVMIALVLLYYDMRVRKELYDAAALSQELRY